MFTAVACLLAAAPAPYSLPWQLRPVAATTAVRIDNVLAFREPSGGESGQTWVTLLGLSYAVTPELSPFLRIGISQTSPPLDAAGVSITNLVLGGTYALKADALRFALTLGVAIPMGMGGGDDPDLSALAAARAGVWARSAMDNAMFAVNDLVIFPGASIAYVGGGFTLQAEVTLLELIRVRGANVQPDAAKTNMTMGLHAGYFIVGPLSVGAELRYQRWLSTPAVVANDASGAARDSLSAAFGLRAHLELGDGIWARPGVAYARGLDAPLTAQNANIIQIDLPFVF